MQTFEPWIENEKQGLQVQGRDFQYSLPVPRVNIINFKKMFNQGRDSLRRHHSCAELIQDNLSLLKLQLGWKYLGFGSEISVCFRKGVGFETDVM